MSRQRRRSQAGVAVPLVGARLAPAPAPPALGLVAGAVAVVPVVGGPAGALA